MSVNDQQENRFSILLPSFSPDAACRARPTHGTLTKNQKKNPPESFGKPRISFEENARFSLFQICIVVSASFVMPSFSADEDGSTTEWPCHIDLTRRVGECSGSLPMLSLLRLESSNFRRLAAVGCSKLNKRKGGDTDSSRTLMPLLPTQAAALSERGQSLP